MTDTSMAVEVEDLSVSFIRWGQAVKALQNVSVSIPAGQWVMLIGQNGSGKSTLLKTISGRLAPDAGTVRVHGRPVHTMQATAIAECLFHVHQDPLAGTAPKLTLFENLMIADSRALSSRASKRTLLRKYQAMLEPLGLADRIQQLAGHLSGGERQLIALLIVQLRPCGLVLLDEPLAALDPEKMELCIRVIRSLNEEGKTIIQVTHDENLAMTLGDRTVAIRAGRLVYDEPADRRRLQDVVSNWATMERHS